MRDGEKISTLIPITLGVKERLISLFNDQVICLHVVSCRTCITFDKCCMAKWQPLDSESNFPGLPPWLAALALFVLDLHVVSFFGT